MKVNKEIIQRYHLGQCSPEEMHAVEQWLDNDEAEQSFPEQVNLDQLESKGWNKLASRFELQESVNVKGIKQLKMLRVIRIAACLLLVTATALLYFNFGRNASPVQKQTYQEIIAEKGQKLSFVLPDGTQVKLNSGSRLRFPSKFTDSSRTVSFTGEAFFDVAKDKLRPFSIYTDKASVQVLGTHFNLRAYPSESNTTVVVAEGKVRLATNTGGDALILTANQKGTIALDSLNGQRNLFKTQVYPQKYLAWKDNQLVLDNMSLAQIAEILERWYNVSIHIHSGALLKERYTGSFSNPALKDVLESISFALKCHYKMQQGSFVLYE